MPPPPYVILVGGDAENKRSFLTKYTDGVTDDKSIVVAGMNEAPYIVFVDTPSKREFRDPKTYAWDGIFKHATLIVNFGNWSPHDVVDIPRKGYPIMITWSGDNSETMKRIMVSVQRCYQCHGYS